MRSEADVINQVLAYATTEPSVRAVIRTNLLPKRKYQHSYEFYFVVDDIEKYDGDVFRDSFDERILLYRGDKNYPEMFPNTKAHLMVFKDGITLVIEASDKETFLSHFNREHSHENVFDAETYKKLLDKDGLLPEIERLEETQTLFAKAPSKEEFDGINSEFFWVLKTFSEYTLRKELPAAMFYLNIAVRDLLNRMLRWHIYLQHGTTVDMGILDSNMEKLLEKELFELYKRTYPSADYDDIKKAFDAVVELWHKAGSSVAKHCGYAYPEETEKAMLDFIRTLDLGNGGVGTYTWFKSPVPDDLLVRQVYGVVFSNDGRILLRIENGRYKLTGGKPEAGETFEETLYREYLEELNIELTDIHYLGYLLVEENGDKYAQVRMIARIRDIGESHVDPATEKVYGRELVPVDSVKEHLNYSDLAGNQMLDAAMDLAKEIFAFNAHYSDEGNDLILIEPSASMKAAALEYKNEHFASGDMQVHGSGGLAFYDDYDEWLRHIDAIRISTPERPIQTSTFFSKRVSDGKLIGCIKLHHSLTDGLKSGGHIAYGIRPSERGKGYGKKQLQLGIAYAKLLHLYQVIIACDKDNVTSAVTARSCGGILVNEFEEDGVLKQHYSFDL